MKKIFTTALIATATLTLAACGGSTSSTENTTVTNEAVIDEGSTDNFTAIDSANTSDVAIANGVDLTDNAAYATGNASNAQ